MKSRVFLICIVLLTAGTSVSGQIKVEAQLGGSNYLGLSVNTSYDIPIFNSGNQYLVPSLGLGFMVPGLYDPTCILHSGLIYKYKKWGIGAEVSGFVNNPIWGNDSGNTFVDMIVYPNLNYTFNTQSNWYFKVSAGALIAYEKSFNDSTKKNQLQFSGDVIPGIGISLGYTFYTIN
jgi:hypothetical protein